jgi:multidrug efflux pump subunit AcrB
MLTGTLITIAGFLPIGLARSNAGEYTFSIFAMVGIALISSWIAVVLFTPYLAYALLPKREPLADETPARPKIRLGPDVRALGPACGRCGQVTSLASDAGSGRRFAPGRFREDLG